MKTYILRDKSIQDNCVKFISSLPVGDKPLQVTIAPYKRKRSVEANNRYWLILTCIAGEALRIGIAEQYYQPEHWHEYFKRAFLGKRVVINGDVLLLPESTANKSTLEFMDYVYQVEAWAIERGIVIPVQDAA